MLQILLWQKLGHEKGRSRLWKRLGFDESKLKETPSQSLKGLTQFQHIDNLFVLLYHKYEGKWVCSNLLPLPTLGENQMKPLITWQKKVTDCRRSGSGWKKPRRWWSEWLKKTDRSSLKTILNGFFYFGKSKKFHFLLWFCPSLTLPYYLCWYFLDLLVDGEYTSFLAFGFLGGSLVCWVFF